MPFFFKKKITPEVFYANCVKKTHDLAQKHGFVKGGVKYIPELMPYCSKLIDSDLNCNELVCQFADNEQLVQALSYRCMMYGIILADTWHTDFSNLEEMAEEIESEGPDGYIQECVEDELGFTPTLFSQWMEAVYMTCMVELGEIDDFDESYSYKIMTVCYQMGISMMLSHYGL